MWKNDVEKPTTFLGMYSTRMQTEQQSRRRPPENVEPRISSEVTSRRKCYSVVQRHGGTRAEMPWTLLQIGKQKTSSSCIKSPHLASMIIGSSKRNWKPWENCQTFALQSCWNAFILARIGRPDILWSVNKLARAVTKWTRACGRRLARLISYIHFTSEFRQYCHVGNSAQQCALGLFQDSNFAGELGDSKSTAEGILCILGSRTFVPISRVCKDALDFWDLVIGVSLSPSHSSLCLGRPGALRSQCGERHKIRTMLKPPASEESSLREIDYVAPSAKLSHQNAPLYIFWRQWGSDQDNHWKPEPDDETRFPNHSVALDWLFYRINLDPKIQIKYIDTKNQLVDILTKRTFTCDQWNQLIPPSNMMDSSFLSQPLWAFEFAIAQPCHSGKCKERRRRDQSRRCKIVACAEFGRLDTLRVDPTTQFKFHSSSNKPRETWCALFQFRANEPGETWSIFFKHRWSAPLSRVAVGQEGTTELGKTRCWTFGRELELRQITDPDANQVLKGKTSRIRVRSLMSSKMVWANFLSMKLFGECL